MQEKRDIFDRMMALPILNIFEPFYKKNKEVLLYLFFGGLTFIVSIATYAVFNVSMGINELIANVMSGAGSIVCVCDEPCVGISGTNTYDHRIFKANALIFLAGSGHTGDRRDHFAGIYYLAGL